MRDPPPGPIMPRGAETDLQRLAESCVGFEVGDR
jgi:hypothetical protein